MKNNIIKILLVEDNPGDFRIIRELLIDAFGSRFDLINSTNLKRSQNLVQEESFDIILLDLNLPDCTGLSTYKQIHSSLPATPIIILTGFDDEETGIQAVRSGAQDYLVKGQVDCDLLGRTINYAIERNRLLAELKNQSIELEASKKSFHNIVEKSSDGIIVLDKTGIVRFFNSAAMKQVKLKQGDIINRLLGHKVISGLVTEVDIFCADGSIGIAEMRVVDTNWRGEKAYLALLRDISERVENNQKLIKTQEKLKCALHTLKVNQKKLTEIEKLKGVQELAAGVSHEFSQPLQALSNYLQLMVESGNYSQYITKSKTMIKRIAELNMHLRTITNLEKKEYVNSEIMDIKASSVFIDKLKKKRVLVVDDEKEILDTFVEMFKLKGYICDGALNGIEGLKLLKKNNYALIISDIMMPHMSGPEFFTKVKEMGNNSFFVFITGYEINGDMKKLISKADAVFSKPVSFDRLFNVLSKFTNDDKNL